MVENKKTDRNHDTDIIKVVTVGANSKRGTRNYEYEIDGLGRLGKEIKISPKANITFNKAGFKTEFFVPFVNVLIGIGNDHTADLIMTVDAWEALNKGEEIHITTTEVLKLSDVGSSKYGENGQK